MRSHSILALAIMALWVGSANAKYSGGTGEPNDPYRIATPQDLNDIGNYQEDWDKHFILVNDVNLTEYTGTQFRIIGSFTGVFDGNNHKILNFTWESTGRNGIGLFGYVGSDGQIKNLGLENVYVNAGNGYYVGGLVEYNNGTITNCYSTGRVMGTEEVGGLVGYNYGTITNCYSTGSVSGDYCVCGLVGVNYGTITNCYSTGSVLGNDSVGGLVGYNNYNGTITNCYSTGSVSGNEYVGGLVGVNIGTITNCYSTGSVSGGLWDVGGLVGVNAGAISNCYSAGGVIGDEYVGGLVGTNIGAITNCYSTGSIGGRDDVGGLVGYNPEGTVTASLWDIETSGQSTSAGGTGKTTAEMKKMDTFIETGWDFVEIWGIGENQTYPFLRTEPAGDLDHDKKVNLIDLAILASHWLEGPP